MMRWLELIAQNPGSASVLVISIVLFIAYFAVLLNDIKHMRHSMVTSKDLQIELGEWVDKLNGRYVTRREWNILSKETKDGG